MHKIWRSAAELSAVCLALLSLTTIVYGLHLNLATASLLFVTLVVLLSRIGSFVSSVVASIIAALCLTYLVPPAFSFRVDDPFDVVAIIVFLITSLIVGRLVSTVRKQAETALSSVSCRVIEAEENERQRLSQKLHEDIAQRLNLLVIAIERLKRDSPGAVDVPAVLKQSIEILTDVKTLAHELYSPRLEYLDIAGVMSSFCRDLGKQANVEIDFKSHDLPSVVPSDISLCIFRVLQDALHNAVEHSGVRQFHVQLSGTPDEILLTVSDRGMGFSLATASKAGGLGINHMQERLKLVKGSLSVDSQPQGGTTVRGRVPIRSGSDSRRVDG